MKRTTRRIFLQKAGVTTAAAFSLPLLTRANSNSRSSTSSLKLGLASYTTREFTLEQTIEMCKRTSLKQICLKSMHLPLDSTKDKILKAKALLTDAEIHLYGGGVIYMKNKAEVDQAFDYAKTAGMQVIIGVPAHELLPYVDQKVKEYDIKVAIHNHGPGDKNYPSPESIIENIKHLDKRIGLCMDIGHTMRMGEEPATEAKKYFDRLLDVHMKDVDKPVKDGKTVVVGQGVIDIPAFLKVLVQKKYQGVVSFEYEADGKDPLPGLEQSVGYVRGVLAVIE